MLYALHGNLQTPAVWDKFREQLRDREGRPVHWEREDLRGALQMDFADWAEDFCGQVEFETKGRSRPWLLGYSLGGRLALHALLKQPGLWRGVIVVGANPGLPDGPEKAARLKNDMYWAGRFRSEPWENVVRDWDAQPVFQHAGEPVKNPCPPREGDFFKGQVARLFDTFSLGRQDDLRPALAGLYQAEKTPPAPPVLFLSGQYDTKFGALGEELAALCPGWTHRVLPGGGHRAPWEAPAAFTRAVQDFIGGPEPVLIA